MRWPSSRTRSAKPTDSSLLTYESSFATSSTVTRMSIIGFAANPGTAVDPLCVTDSTTSPMASLITSPSASKREGQAESYSMLTMGCTSPPPIKTASKCSSDSRFMGLSGHHPDRWVRGPGNHSRLKSGTEQNST